MITVVLQQCDARSLAGSTQLSAVNSSLTLVDCTGTRYQAPRPDLGLHTKLISLLYLWITAIIESNKKSITWKTITGNNQAGCCNADRFVGQPISLRNELLLRLETAILPGSTHQRAVGKAVLASWRRRFYSVGWTNKPWRTQFSQAGAEPSASLLGFKNKVGPIDHLRI